MIAGTKDDFFAFVFPHGIYPAADDTNFWKNGAWQCYESDYDANIECMPTGIALDDVALAAKGCLYLRLPRPRRLRPLWPLRPLPRDGATTSFPQPLVTFPLLQTALFKRMIEERGAFFLISYPKVAIIKKTSSYFLLSYCSGVHVFMVMA